MASVALLSNPRSTGNRSLLPRVRAFCAEHKDIFHYEVEDVSQIGLAMRTIAPVAQPTTAPVLKGPEPRGKFSEAFNAHCARVAYEIGADLVKVQYTGSPESFARVVKSVPIPVVMAA